MFFILKSFLNLTSFFDWSGKGTPQPGVGERGVGQVHDHRTNPLTLTVLNDGYR